MTTTTTSTAIAVAEPVFSKSERQALAGFLAGYTGLTLRHAFITAALDAGRPPADVQEAASHADPRTTIRYDRARACLDRHAIYIVAASAAGTRTPSAAAPHCRDGAPQRPGSTLTSAASKRSSLVVTKRDDQTVSVPYPAPPHCDVHCCWTACRRERRYARCDGCLARRKGGLT
jgi:hypothetical protein